MSKLLSRLLLLGVACCLVLLLVAAPAQAVSVAFLPPSGGWDYAYGANAGQDVYDGDTTNASHGDLALDGNWTHHNGSDSWRDNDGTTGPPYVPDRLGAGVGAVGGVEVLSEADLGSPGGTVSFLRIMDGVTTGSSTNPGDNRRYYFMTDLSKLPGYTSDFMDTGVTLSFRARLTPDAALEGALTAANKGGMVGSDGKGMFGFRQATNDQIVTFSLHTATEDGPPTPAFSGAGLTLNKNVQDTGSSGSVGNPSSAGFPQNDVALDPNAWHELWILIAKNDDTPGNGTHTATIYMDGSLAPAATVNFTAGNGDEGTSSLPLMSDYLELGQNFTPLNGSYDTDFVAVKFGSVAPVPEPSTLAMLAAVGLLGLLGWARRRAA